jgi:REP element-mobilizing transposase RayT
MGEIRDGRMNLSYLGRIVRDELRRTERIRPDVTLDTFVVMPNHVHGIIVINRDPHFAETHCNVSLPGATDPDVGNRFGPQVDNLASIIRGFKSSTAATINKRFGPNTFAWQPRYHDRIIRNADELERIRWYIRNNPRMWGRDRNH